MAATAATLADLRTPAFVVDRTTAARNAQRMRDQAAALSVALRPHLKTHKTVEGALLQLSGDRTAPCVVSTLGEARWFITNGFTNLLYAVPIGEDKLAEVFALQRDHGAQLHVFVDTATAAEFTNKAAAAADRRQTVFLKIDCGYGRAGVPVHDAASIALAKRIAALPSLELLGIYCHAGHSYDCCGVDERSAGLAHQIEAAAEAERKVAVAFAAALNSESIRVPIVSVGATPTCSRGRNWAGCTELHPGNYLFYDVQQVAAGSAAWADCACVVLTRVLSVYPDRRRLLVDAGGLALSKDTAPAGYPGYGHILGHDDLILRKLSQEVGIVEAVDKRVLTEAEFPLGTLLAVVPNHACLAAACHDVYAVVDSLPRAHTAEIGRTPIVERWRRCPELW